MTEFQAYLVVALSVAALCISLLSYLSRRTAQASGKRQAWHNAVISWSSGVMDEMETVLHIFKQLKYGASFDDVMDEIVVSKSNISVLLDYGALLITQSLDAAGKEAVSGGESKDALKAVAAVHARLCRATDSGCRLDVEESILYVAQCRKMFIDDIRSNMALASPDNSVPATLWKN
ncbi:hypothetical protein [Solidesulfovibrio magneticus]|uniref:hypothetical protein n=1 Tax=Solidesulfovibrio magneticus TaxID=184917 RepID=UPI0005BBB371|nr:hypothetical protein [Solidesulfovibrio magneticus]